MKISIAPKTTGAIWLVLFILIPAFLLAAWLLWKIFHWNPTIDPYHGIPDPETNQTSTVQSVIAQYGSNATVFVPELGITLPIESLAYEWTYLTQTSTNLTDWVEVQMDWNEILESIATNHFEPCRFYRRLLITPWNH